MKGGGAESARLRKRFPKFAEMLDDFKLSRTYRDAFIWHEMPAGWRYCQRVLSGEYERIVSLEQAKQSAMLEMLLKRGAM